MFFPRGGSAHVVRSLARALPAHGWDAPVLSGSLPGRDGDAHRFFSGLDVTTVDLDPAAQGPHPLLPRPRRPPRRLRPGGPGPRPAGRRPAVPPLLRGPARGARPGLRD